MDSFSRCLDMAPALLRDLTRYCGEREVAEEAAQDALLAAYEQGTDLEEIDRLWGWLRRVGINRLHSYYRRTAAERRALERMAPATHAPDPADEVAIRLLLTRLSGRYRTVLWMRIVEQRTVAETASALGCAEGTVKSLTHRAVAKLRAEVQV